MVDLKDIANYCDHYPGMDSVYEVAYDLSRGLPQDRIFIEIGTRAGGSALNLMRSIRDSGNNRWLWTVDPYGGKRYKRGQETVDMGYGEDFYTTAMDVLTSAAKEHELLHCHWRMTSNDFLSYIENIGFWHEGSKIKPVFGFAYLDGEHDVKSILHEIFCLIPMMPEGIIVVDDIEYVENEPAMQSYISLGSVEDNRLYLTVEEALAAGG